MQTFQERITKELDNFTEILISIVSLSLIMNQSSKLRGERCLNKNVQKGLKLEVSLKT